jgi:hypothetical protein
LSLPIDPAESPDPVIREAAARRERYRAEIERLDALLGAYAARMRQAQEAFPVAPLEHSTMLDDGNCGCSVCSEWTERREEFVTALGLLPDGHKWSTCSCPQCRFIALAHTNFLAAANKRDLTIEVAYHAKNHSKHGLLVMAWLEKDLTNPRYTTRWCAHHMGQHPVHSWLLRCEAALGPVVSGAVFRLDTD